MKVCISPTSNPKPSGCCCAALTLVGGIVRKRLHCCELLYNCNSSFTSPLCFSIFIPILIVNTIKVLIFAFVAHLSKWWGRKAEKQQKRQEKGRKCHPTLCLRYCCYLRAYETYVFGEKIKVHTYKLPLHLSASMCVCMCVAIVVPASVEKLNFNYFQRHTHTHIHMSLLTLADCWRRHFCIFRLGTYKHTLVHMFGCLCLQQVS